MKTLYFAFAAMAWWLTIEPLTAAINPAALVSPGRNEADVSLQPTLVWQDVAVATLYEWQLFQGTTLIDSGRTGGSVHSVTINAVLAPGTVYNWHVRGGTSAQSGPWSETRYFSTRPPIPQVVLTSPANGAVGTGRDVTLRWQTVAYATGYQYEILQNGSVVLSGGGSPGLLVTVPSAGIYQWRVRGRSSNEDGPWSSLFTFDTRTPINPPALVSPDRNEGDVSLQPELVWQDVAVATLYEWQLFQGTALVDSGRTDGATRSATINVVLTPNTLYNWHVRGGTSAQDGQWSETRYFVTRPPIPQVMLTSPIDGAVDTTTAVILQWQTVPYATGYQYEIVRNGTLVLTSNGSPGVTVTVPGAGVYQWRVRGVTRVDQGPWSSLFTFDTRKPLNPPQLVSPGRNEGDVSLQPELVWQGVSGATLYDWELFQGTTLVESGHVGGTVRTGLLSVVLVPGTLYNWHARGGTSAQDGPWSETRYFVTRAPLQTPAPIFPSDGAENTGLNFSLNWQTVPVATGYQYEIWKDGTLLTTDFGSPIVNVTLPSAGVYQWRVRSRTSLDNSAWSAFVTFNTRPSIGTPTLISPTNNAVGLGLKPTFAWANAANTTHFKWELFQGASLIDSGVTSASTRTAEVSVVLAPGTLYNWHVRGYTAVQTGQWSQAWYFTTRPALQAPVPISPSNVSVSGTSPIVLNWNPIPFATRYDFEVYQNGITNRSGTPGIAIFLPNPGIYQWRVRGADSFENGPWSEWIPFEAFRGWGGDLMGALGGVIFIKWPGPQSGFCSSFLMLTVGPAEAIADGAAWRVRNAYPNYTPFYEFRTNAATLPLGNGAFELEFAPARGWIPPQPRILDLSCATNTSLVFNYTPSNPPSLRVLIEPPEAVADGAEWRIISAVPEALAAFTNYSASTNPFSTTNSLTFDFKRIDGWVLPPSARIQLYPGQTNEFRARYERPVRLLINPHEGLRIAGSTGSVYRIEYQNLGETNWNPQEPRYELLQRTNTIINPLPANTGVRLYRAIRQE